MHNCFNLIPTRLEVLKMLPTAISMYVCNKHLKMHFIQYPGTLHKGIKGNEPYLGVLLKALLDCRLI